MKDIALYITLKVQEAQNVSKQNDLKHKQTNKKVAMQNRSNRTTSVSLLTRSEILQVCITKE